MIKSNLQKNRLLFIYNFSFSFLLLPTRENEELNNLNKQATRAIQ
ncbi:hypothetical protein [Listeria phage 184]